MNLNTPENVLTNLVRTPSSNGNAQVDLRTMFLQPPQVVEQIPHQQVFAAPSPRLDGTSYAQILEHSVDAAKLETISRENSYPFVVFELVRNGLTSRSTKALALHFYIDELLKLCEITVARKIIEKRKIDTNQYDHTVNFNAGHCAATS